MTATYDPDLCYTLLARSFCLVTGIGDEKNVEELQRHVSAMADQLEASRIRIRDLERDYRGMADAYDRGVAGRHKVETELEEARKEVEQTKNDLHRELKAAVHSADHYHAQVLKVAAMHNELLAERDQLRDEVERLSADNHTLWQWKRENAEQAHAARAEADLMRPVVLAAARYWEDSRTREGIIAAVDTYRAARDKGGGCCARFEFGDETHDPSCPRHNGSQP